MSRINPKRRLGLLIALIAVLACGLGGLKLNANYTAYFDPSDPVLLEHREVAETFAEHDSVVVVLDFAAAEATQTESIAFLRALVEAIENLSTVTRVSSVVNLLDPELEADAHPLLDEILGDESDRRDIGTPIDVDPRGVGISISRDRRAALIDIEFSIDQQVSPQRLLASMGALRDVIKTHIENSGIAVTAHYTGTLALNEAYIRVVRHDLKRFLPALVIITTIVLGWLLRSVASSLALLLVAALAVVAGFGLGGWLNVELAAISAFAPIMIASLVIAGGVHFVSVFARASAEQSIAQALVVAREENRLPLALTNLTTALGFAALSLSPSPPIQTLGWVVAAGVLFGWLFVFSVLPELLRLLAQRGFIARPRHYNVAGLVAAVKGRHLLIISVAVALIVSGVVLNGANRINDNVFEYFAPGHALRVATEEVAERFSGVNKAVYHIGGTTPYDAFDTDLVEAVRGFSAWLAEQPEVNHVMSLLALPQVRQKLSGDNEESVLRRYRALATSQTTDGLGVSQLVDGDFKALAVHVYLGALDSQALLDFDRRARGWLSRHADPFEVSGGGTSLVFAELGERNARSMVITLVAALVIVAIACAIALRSLHAAGFGLVCNLAPLVIVYAVWAIVDGRISLGGAVVIGMVVGIIVDDTVYLLTRYARERARGTTDPVTRSLTGVGPALITTSLSLCAGLSTGLLSEFAPISTMSLLSVAVIAVALIVNLTLLPSLLVARERCQHPDEIVEVSS